MSLALLCAGCASQTAKETTLYTPDQDKPGLAKVTTRPGLPNVLIIGDSISIGYVLPTRAALAGETSELIAQPTPGQVLLSLPADLWTATPILTTTTALTDLLAAIPEVVAAAPQARFLFVGRGDADHGALASPPFFVGLHFFRHAPLTHP